MYNYLHSIPDRDDYGAVLVSDVVREKLLTI
jgi:hypothetical protein